MDIMMKQKTAVTLSMKVTIFCDERQKGLVESAVKQKRPETLFNIPRNAVIVETSVIDEEIMGDMSNEAFRETMIKRIV